MKKGSSSSRSSSPSSANLSFTEFVIFFKEFIISYFARVICCDSTYAKWIFSQIGMIFQVINACNNPVNNILSRW